MRQRDLRPLLMHATDVLVIGGGVAALQTAVHAVPRRTTILTREPVGRAGSSPLAQGGVAVALGPDDDPARHAADTLAAGDGLCDEAVVAAITEEGPRRVLELEALGARFDREEGGCFSLGREAAHGRRRIVHASGDATGAELVRALAAAARRNDHIAWVEGVLVLELLAVGGRVVGALGIDRCGRRQVWRAAEVVLATGGVGGLYRWTTNPAESSGAGLAMAARVGARLADLEMVQFHPTAMAVNGDPLPLLTEALRGEGGVLVDERGERIMSGVHLGLDLAPRDVVARAIEQRLATGGNVLLDLRRVWPDIAGRFATVAEICRSRGIDPAREALPVVPAAHYHMGGVVTDLEGRTSRPGLAAVGEVGCTGLHGANRLASNSLLEALVVGARLGERLVREVRSMPGNDSDLVLRAADAVSIAPAAWTKDDSRATAATGQLRVLMSERVGVVRDGRGLAVAAAVLAELTRRAPAGRSELGNMVEAAAMITAAAAARCESRGAHFRCDHPYALPSGARRRLVDPSTSAAHWWAVAEPATA